MATGRKQRRNANIQLFFTVVCYLCCLYKILEPHYFTNKIMKETLFFFLDRPSFCCLSAFLLAINAIAMTFVLRKLRLIEFKNYFPSLFYLLFSFVFSTCLNPLILLVGTVFIFGIFYNSFDFEENNTHRKMFLIGFSAGILALIHLPLIAVLFFAYLVAVIYRRINFRILLLPIVGVILPFIYWYSISYIIGIDFSFQETLQQMKMNILHFQFFEMFKISTVFAVLLLLIALKLIHSLLVAIGKASVLRRKKYDIMLLFFLFSIVFSFLYAQFYWEILLMLYAIIISVANVIKNVSYKGSVRSGL